MAAAPSGLVGTTSRSGKLRSTTYLGICPPWSGPIGNVRSRPGPVVGRIPYLLSPASLGAVLADPDDGLGPVAHFQFAENRRDMMSDRLGRNVEAFGDLPVGESLAEQAEHLGLTSGQAGGVGGGGLPRSDRNPRDPHAPQLLADTGRHRSSTEFDEDVEGGPERVLFA